MKCEGGTSELMERQKERTVDKRMKTTTITGSTRENLIDHYYRVTYLPESGVFDALKRVIVYSFNSESLQVIERIPTYSITHRLGSKFGLCEVFVRESR